MFRKMLPVAAMRSLACVGALLGWSTFTAAMAYDRHILLENKSKEAVIEFHASNVGTDDWQDDILGEDILFPGNVARIDLDDGTGYCRFDFKTVLQKGETIVRRNVDVCTLARYTIS